MQRARRQIQAHADGAYSLAQVADDVDELRLRAPRLRDQRGDQRGGDLERERVVARGRPRGLQRGRHRRGEGSMIDRGGGDRASVLYHSDRAEEGSIGSARARRVVDVVGSIDGAARFASTARVVVPRAFAAKCARGSRVSTTLGARRGGPS
eukprot:31484-Pelagococcus_subviridis.AAC.10